MSERLSKYISRAGVASRRKSEEIIASGRVSVNGVTTFDPAFQVTFDVDEVTVDGSSVHPVDRFIYVALYKPSGYMSDLYDPRGRKIARDLIPITSFLFPVGRLDYDSEGLLLFTNDGAFANLVMHPRFEVEKEYLVKLHGKLSDADTARLLKGVSIGPDRYKVRSITAAPDSSANAWYHVVVTEGKNRMIRKLAQAVGHPVLRLRRLRIDGITISGLKPGQYRNIDRQTVNRLCGSSSTRHSDRSVRPHTATHDHHTEEFD